MKIPNVIFIKHVPSLSPERKEFLLEHLDDRLNSHVKDIRWCEDYNFDHPFVEWLNKTYKLPYGPKLTSNFVKTLYCFKTMVDENIESALFIDDDVTFHRNWVNIVKSVDIPDNIMFVNLGTSYFFPHTVPQIGKGYVLPNNGGCEGAWCSLKFAREFLDSINMMEATDIIFHGFLHSKSHPIINVPVCYQTSHLTNISSLDHNTRTSKNWVEFVRTYRPQVKFDQLLSEYADFLKLKKQKEEKIWELYGTRIDIKNIEYILGRTDDFCNDILKFE